jgi:hypothetical protein
MATLNAASLTDLLNDDDLTATIAENILDAAIRTLILYGVSSLSVLAGSAGTKQATVTEAQYGGIIHVANQIYISIYKVGSSSGSSGSSSTAYGLGGMSFSQSASSNISSSVINNPEVLVAVKDVAKQLVGMSFEAV